MLTLPLTLITLTILGNLHILNDPRRGVDD